MTENFLVSESLKSSLTKETLYKNVNNTIKLVPIITEIRNSNNQVELDVMINDNFLRQEIKLTSINFNEISYTFKKSLNFKIDRIFFNEAKNTLYTIVIDKEIFWSNL
tara:strand:- start:849 stop:1172 length:324 start_codon:yes stop_codon:yes gene_type:complete